MRADICGFFWDDTPPPKPPKKEQVKCIPPDPVWLRPDYLPYLDEARAWRPCVMTDAELVLACERGERLVWDIECYPNYFLIAFQSTVTYKFLFFEMGEGETLDCAKLRWVIDNFLLIDFNGNNYDVPIVSLAIAGKPSFALYEATSEIIEGGPKNRPNHVLKRAKVKRATPNHIDLIELVALKPSLKLLAGRLHSPRMQDLPFKPGTTLSEPQRCITKYYCANDLENTLLLYQKLKPEIELREKMSAQFSMDLRSKSDAQIAEAVIGHELRALTGARHIQRPNIAPGTKYKYTAPPFISFKTETLNWVLRQAHSAEFEVSPSGKLLMPAQLKKLRVPINGSIYRMGIGGLHSSEKQIARIAGQNMVLADWDVESFYPRIILLCGLAPSHLGKRFLQVYEKIVKTRLAAKNATVKTEALTTTAEGLKVVINGGFGKFGSMYSILCSPDLLIQVTVTGQLSLFMLIERLELAGFTVVSANTDGIVIHTSKANASKMAEIIACWERDTGFKLEENRYLGLFCRDVNNYFAVKQKRNKATGEWLMEPDGFKVKGIYSERGSSRNSTLSKNPTSQICSDAVAAYLMTGAPIVETIRRCNDIRKFLTVRKVFGGAVKDGQYLGVAIRWYYATDQSSPIIYAKTGNKVPRSDGAKPCMTLPECFPNDLDFAWYENEAMKILVQIGCLEGTVEDEEDKDEIEDEE